MSLKVESIVRFGVIPALPRLSIFDEIAQRRVDLAPARIVDVASLVQAESGIKIAHHVIGRSSAGSIFLLECFSILHQLKNVAGLQLFCRSTKGPICDHDRNASRER